MKTCSKCGEEKSLAQFYRNKSAPDGYRADCKLCLKDNVTELRMARQENQQALMQAYGIKNALELRDARFRRLYNISLEQYVVMFEAQGGRCKICRQASDIALSVDHDHACCSERARSCGECIRGLLCSNCNKGLGNFQDNPEILRSALSYLAR